MAEKTWSGFSEEELNKIRYVEEPNQEIKKPVKKTSLKQTRHKKKIEIRSHNSLKQPVEMNSKTTDEETLNKNLNGLVQLRIDEDGHVLEVVENFNAKKNLESSEKKEDNSEEPVKNSEKKILGNEDIVFTVIDDKINSENLTNLEKFQMRQKQMEEQNKQRRALLTQAIIDRQKRTQAENEKLLYIQKEMTKLDNLVSGDVAILRNHIEHASMEFNEAQKRYKKAEEEFVQAKIELFRRLDRKEQLIEHLCTIIEQNELRKAQMLIRLMKELEMEELTEDCLGDDAMPILPQLCCMSDSLGGCSTIKNLHCPSKMDGIKNDNNDVNTPSPTSCDAENNEPAPSITEKTASTPENIKNGSSFNIDENQMSSHSIQSQSTNKEP